jgi:flavodoxin I
MTVLATAKVGIFYSTGTGNTKRVANLIKVHLGDSADVPQPVSASHARDFEGYDAIIFGAPSYMWEKHRVSALDFDTIEPPFDDFKDLKGKKVAIFGLGNQAEYPKNFCDAIGILWEHFSMRGADMVGSIENEGYDFKRSRALKQGVLVGLPLDVENQEGLVGDQVEAWVKQLKVEMNL